MVRVPLLGGVFLLIPLVVIVREGAAEFVELFLVVDHFFAGVTGRRKDILEDDRLFRADFFAESAVDAAEHIDVELLRCLFDVGAVRIFFVVDFAGLHPNGFWRADELAELAGDAFFAAVRIFDERRHAPVVVGDLRPLFRILKRDRLLKHRADGGLQATDNLRDEGFLRKSQRLAFDYFRLGHG